MPLGADMGRTTIDDGDWYYFGRLGFYGDRGGSFGPCWTRTPIGPIWNCG
jgi:hypothetical protein